MTSPADAIKSAVRSVTKDWAKQRKAEERDRNAVFNRRHRLVRSARLTIRDAAFDVMEEAYLAASDNGSLPVKPRQIMYAARPKILKMTGQVELGGSYFSQQLLIDYMEEYDYDDWDITWDARGHFIEPHTGIEAPLGTLEVRQYLGERPSFQPADLNSRVSFFPTSGPENRFGNILFIEKEGFHPLLQATQLQERFDVAVMSTKGMSVTAARKLLDELTPFVENIFVLHDFDRSAFSICGTLGTDSRRYRFNNDPPIIDIGLRLDDVIDMDLQSEPVPPISSTEWGQRRQTLRRHGASPEEIAFLRDKRVELNAMTSRQLIDFIERKFQEHGVKKVIPDDAVIEKHARRVIEHSLIEREIAKISAEFSKQAAATALPEDLREQLEEFLKEHPECPWDIALAALTQIIVAKGTP
jgi:Topoisomerase 6 subunit A/Spo11, Toprim domain